MAKQLQNSNVYLFNCNQGPFKKCKSKIYFHNFLGHVEVLIHAKYRKDRIKTLGAYTIWTQVDGQTDGRHRYRISSADYVSSGTKKFSPTFWRVCIIYPNSTSEQILQKCNIAAEYCIELSYIFQWYCLPKCLWVAQQLKGSYKKSTATLRHINPPSKMIQQICYNAQLLFSCKIHCDCTWHANP